MTVNIDPSLIDVVLPEESGYPAELAADDNRESLMMAADDAGALVTAFPDSMWIERRDWAERARENKENKTRAFDYVDRFTNQGGGSGIRGTHECTTHSETRAAEGCYNRARRIAVGPPVPRTKLEVPAGASPVWLSPLSIYAEANPNQWGGASVRGVLNIAARRGFLPDKIQPRDYGFKHTLHGTCGVGNVTQSRGPWVPVSRFPEGWQETAKNHRPIEFIFPESFEQAVCLILHGFFVCVGRDGHAVPWGDVNMEQSVIPYLDSYDVVRYDSFNRAKAAIRNGGSFSIVSMTTPDDWDKPAE